MSDEAEEAADSLTCWYLTFDPHFHTAAGSGKHCDLWSNEGFTSI